MRRILFLAIVLSVSLARAETVSVPQVQAAIAQFLDDPTAPASKSAPRQILQFSEESADHEIAIDSKYLPWLEGNNTEDSPLLLAAFLAGNLREQFARNTGKPQPYAGVLSVIDVYRKLQAKKPSLRISQIEKQIELEKQGKLKAQIEAD